MNALSEYSLVPYGSHPIGQSVPSLVEKELKREEYTVQGMEVLSMRSTVIR